MNHPCIEQYFFQTEQINADFDVQTDIFCHYGYWPTALHIWNRDTAPCQHHTVTVTYVWHHMTVSQGHGQGPVWICCASLQSQKTVAALWALHG